MTYNAKIINEQGASVLRVDSSGSISVQAGGTISGAGTIQTTGAVTLTGAISLAGAILSTSEVTAASLTVSAGGMFMLGSNVQLQFAKTNSPPVTVASPGALFFRSDGSMSAVYVNTSDGTAGSVWVLGGTLE